MDARKVRCAAKYIRRMVTRPHGADCPACEGTGWTLEGWAAKFPGGFDASAGIDPFKGDCPVCNGTGEVVQQ